MQRCFQQSIVQSRVLRSFLHECSFLPNLKPNSLVLKITLITCDFFGAHYCNEAVFSNKICTSKEAEKDMWDAYKYYFDCVRNSTLLKTYLQIFGPFKPYVLKGLDIVNSLPVENICCSHGPVLRDNLKKYIGKRKLLIVLIV